LTTANPLVSDPSCSTDNVYVVAETRDAQSKHDARTG